MNMMKVCGRMPGEVRLEKIGAHQSMKGQFTIKYFIFRIVGKIPCVVPKFPVFSLSGKIGNQIPCFPCAVATLKSVWVDRLDVEDWCRLATGYWVGVGWLNLS